MYVCVHANSKAALNNLVCCTVYDCTLLHVHVQLYMYSDYNFLNNLIAVIIDSNSLHPDNAIFSGISCDTNGIAASKADNTK